MGHRQVEFLAAMFVIALVLGGANAAQAGPIVIDFDVPSYIGDGWSQVASPYDEDDFRLTAESGVFGLWENGSPNFLGSQAFAEHSGQSQTLRRIDGSTFDLIEIKLSELIDGEGTSWAVTFVGTHTDDTTTAPAQFVLDGTFGFQTFALPGDFTDLKSVTWWDLTPPTYGNTTQYDDIVLVPEPGTIGLLGSGVVWLALVRQRRRR